MIQATLDGTHIAQEDITFFGKGGAALQSDKMDWATPQQLFDKLHKEFCFTIDVCAVEWNAKIRRYWNPEDNALLRDWKGERCFMNPPYGREIGIWIQKARQEADKGALVVALIPSRTDTAYWHDHIEGVAEVRFLRGRVKFEQLRGVQSPAPFPSAIVIWKPKERILEENDDGMD